MANQQEVRIKSKNGWSIWATIEHGSEEPKSFVVRQDKTPEQVATMDEAEAILAKYLGETPSDPAADSAGNGGTVRKKAIPFNECKFPPEEQHPWKKSEVIDLNGLEDRKPSLNQWVKKWEESGLVAESKDVNGKTRKEGKSILYEITDLGKKVLAGDAEPPAPPPKKKKKSAKKTAKK